MSILEGGFRGSEEIADGPDQLRAQARAFQKEQPFLPARLDWVVGECESSWAPVLAQTLFGPRTSPYGLGIYSWTCGSLFQDPPGVPKPTSDQIPYVVRYFHRI